MTESSKSKVKFGIQETNSTSRSASSIQQNFSRTTIDTAKNSKSKIDGGSGSSKQNDSDEEEYVENLLKEVFLCFKCIKNF